MSQALRNMLVFLSIIGIASTGIAGSQMTTLVFGQSISFDECKSRVSSALRAEGYGNWRDFGNGWIGFTAAHSASISCIKGVGETVVVIVVAGESDPFPPRDRLAALIRSGGKTEPRGCGWRDGQDSNAPADDTGRGILDGNVHYNHVATGSGRGSVHTIVGNRLRTLSGCLPRDTFARAYADISVRIAEAGRIGAGWVDGMDGRGGDDPGRGLSDWQAHFQHVASGPGLSIVHITVVARLAALRDRMPTDAYAHLYADVSVVLARYGVKGQ